MEDKVDGLLGVEALLLLDVLLGGAENLGGELHVAGGVDAVDVTEGGGHGEHAGGNLVELGVHLVDLLGLGVEVLLGDVGVVDAILLAAGDADLNLEVAVDLSHALEVLLGDLHVLLDGLLGEVEHVGAEQGLAVLGEVLLVSLEEAVEPGEERLGAVVGVEDDGDTVELGEGAHVEGTRDAAHDGSLLVSLVLPALAGVVDAAAVGELDDHGRVGNLGRLEARVGHGGHGAVHGGDGVAVLLGVVDDGPVVIAGDDASLEALDHRMGEGKDEGQGRFSEMCIFFSRVKKRWQPGSGRVDIFPPFVIGR